MLAFRACKTMRLIAVLIASGLLSGCAPMTDKIETAAAPEAQTAPRTSFPHEKSDLAADPALMFGRLENGFRYVLMENREPKDRVSMHLNIQAGSLHETENQRGLAHFLEHMLFNGSEHFPPGELVKYFQRIGMDFGSDANAHTGFDETVYDILLPQNDSESIAEGLLVMRDYAAGALLLPEEVERERGVILAEKQARDSAAYRLFETTFRFEMQGIRAAQRLPIGTEDSIREANRARLKHYYDTWYRPDKLILVMVGDFDPTAAESMIVKRFSDLAARAPAQPEPDLGNVDHRGVKPFYHHEAETGDTTVSIEALSTVPAADDSLALQKEKLLADVAQRMVQNRLDRILRDDNAPFTSAYVSAGRFLGRVDYAEISAKGPPGNWRERLFALEQILRQALEYGFRQSELDRVRKDMIAEMDDAVRKASTRNSQDLARRLIRHLNDNKVFQSPDQRKALFEPFLSALNVDQVHEAFRRTWGPDHRLVLVTGNARIGEEDESAREAIRSAFAESSNQAVVPYRGEQAAVFPFFPLPKEVEAIRDRRMIDDLRIVQVDTPQYQGNRLQGRRDIDSSVLRPRHLRRTGIPSGVGTSHAGGRQ